MNKHRIALGLATAAAVVVGASPAQASGWDTTIRSIKNLHTDKCLSGKGREVVQETCGLPVSGGVRSTDWDIYTSPIGIQLLRNRATGLCLDNNGSDVYLSGCTTEDYGQYWEISGCEQWIGNAGANQLLIGWNDGGVAVKFPDNADEQAKTKWSVTGIGC
ncbi:hypothetical protein AB0L14_28415 [Streptomyces sp. NPDC052727]|uniref:hypothetical protein n=1 Tax=Streptomyces sp. NPDC052727 TaxID=3154854 RepID=UPI00343B4D5A